MQTFGERLEAARRRRVMTRGDLARAAGVSLATIDRYAHGETETPRPSTVRKIAAALDVDPEWLLFGDVDEDLGKPPREIATRRRQSLNPAGTGRKARP